MTKIENRCSRPSQPSFPLQTQNCVEILGNEGFPQLACEISVSMVVLSMCDCAVGWCYSPVQWGGIIQHAYVPSKMCCVNFGGNFMWTMLGWGQVARKS